MNLTQSREKERYYAADSYVIETLEQLRTLTPDPVGFAVHHALLLVKPDAVVTRSIGRIEEWLSSNGFRIVAARPVQLDRGMVRAMWHYQLNRATPQRCQLADAIARQGRSLVLLLDREPADEQPVSEMLSALKGPADPARRRPGQLRSHLGHFGFLFNLVHASDEPADVVRELGILLEAPERRALLTHTGPVDLAGLAEELYAEQAPHDLAFEPAAARLRAAFAELPRGQKLLETTIGWGPLIELIWSEGLPLEGWDPIVVGHAALPLTRPEIAQLLPGLAS